MLQTIRRLYAMLTPAQRRQFRWLQLLIAIVAVIQVAGVVSIAPYVALLANPSLIETNRFVHAVYEYGGFGSTVDFLTALAAVLILAILVANALSALSTWMITRYSIHVGQSLQRDVYRHHLHKDYALHAQRNSAALVAQMSHDSPRLAYMVLTPVLNLSSQLLIIVLIAFILVSLSWKAAMAAVVLIGGGYLAVYAYIQKGLVSCGEVVSRTARDRQKQLTESVIGIKEVKLLGTERLLEEQMARVNADSLQATAAIAMFGELPRYVLETVALAALLGMATLILRTEGATAEVVGMMSLYAMAAYKLLPAAQGLFKCVSQIRANEDVVHALYAPVMAGRASVHQGSDSARTENALGSLPVAGDIQLRAINYRYPGAKTQTLTDVSFTVRRHTLVALVGASGAGKSTIADILLGLLFPDSGTLAVDSTPIQRSNVRAWQRMLGYVPQTIFMADDTIAANIAFGVSSPDPSALATAARLANIDTYINSLPDGYSFRVGERGALLSGGQRQRLGIARALYRDPEILVMDEATSALDAVTEQEIMQTLAHLKRHKTIIMIAHRLSTIEAADSVVLIDAGRVVGVGTSVELREQSSLFNRIVAAAKGEQTEHAIDSAAMAARPANDA